MQDWINRLDSQLKFNDRAILLNKGKISHKDAVEKAEKEFEIYRRNEMKNLNSDFDKEIKKLKKIQKNKHVQN